MFAALAEFERSLIRERTQAGLRAARRAGRTGGRPAKLTEDDLDVAATLLANPDITVAEVAERLGVSPATLSALYPAAHTTHFPDEIPNATKETLHHNHNSARKGDVKLVKIMAGILEKMIGNLNVIDWRKDKKFAKLGAKLYVIYFRLNEIIVQAEDIIGSIDVYMNRMQSHL